MWTFTEPSELVPGEWTFQVFRGAEKILEKKFEVQKAEGIHDRYVPDYYKKMTVSVLPKSETQFYFVDGEVKLPNRQVYLSRTTVLKAIASAGGFTDFASKGNVTLTRVDGRTVKVNCKKAQMDPRLDLEIFPGDKIWVPRRIF
jgi:polysaccharide export outer membrane protein